MFRTIRAYVKVLNPEIKAAPDRVILKLCRMSGKIETIKSFSIKTSDFFTVRCN